MSNSESPDLRGSMSFTNLEIRTMCTVFETIARGGDARVLLRNIPVNSVWGKFLRMHKRLEEKGSNGKSATEQEPTATGTTSKQAHQGA